MNVECEDTLEYNATKEVMSESPNPAKNCLKGEISDEIAQELDTGFTILTDIIKQNKSACIPFMDKVDTKGLGLWDYEDKIKQPMWLNKMHERFEFGSYTSITNFVTDFRIMVENCYRYNGTDSQISKKAKRLEMALVAKLCLLKRELKEKTTLQATLNGRFALKTNEDVGIQPSRSNSHSLRDSNTREYASVMDDAPDLVYEFVRCEESMLLENERKSSHRERRQQEMLYHRIAAAWISSIESSPDAALIKSCDILPQIGFFLHLCESFLKLPQLNMYTLERSILVPESSLYLAKIMTCLLCTYQERSQLTQRSPMLYSTWNNRLKARLRKWFETALKYNSYEIAAEKLGLNILFFEVMEWKNPFLVDDEASYSKLSFRQRVHILKALCDNISLLPSVQNAMLAMDPLQLQCMTLGKDLDGNIYIYFPQFCGDDLRLYRHRQYGEPEIKNIPKVSKYLALLHVNGEKFSEIQNDSNTQIQQEPTEELASHKFTAKNSKSTVLSRNNDNLASPSIIPSPLNIKENNVPDDIDNKTSDSNKGIDVNEAHSTDGKNNLEDVWNTQRKSHRKRNEKTVTEAVNYELRRSLRKRSIPNQNLVDNNQSTNPDPPKRKRKNNRGIQKTEMQELYGNIEFEMLCDSVESLRILLSEIEVQNQKHSGDKTKLVKDQMKELVASLDWLYCELEPWDVKLQKAKRDAQIEMKRDHDKIQTAFNLNQFDLWSVELTSKNAYIHDDNITISHDAVDSPVSSLTSYNSDSSDEDYIQSHTKRNQSAPFQQRYDYNALNYGEERKQLLSSALYELGQVLEENVPQLLKLSNGLGMQDGVTTNDGRCTRHKSKQKSKILRRILKFAEANTTLRPSLLPLLLPDPDIEDVVDNVLMQEEIKQKQTKWKELTKHKKSTEDQLLVESKKKKLQKPQLSSLDNPYTLNSADKNKLYSQGRNLVYQTKNGSIYPAAKLNDGNVVPIARPNQSSPAAKSVSDLLNSLRKDVQGHSSSNVPWISLRNKDMKASIAYPGRTANEHDEIRNTSTNGIQNLGTVTVKRSPNKSDTFQLTLKTTPENFSSKLQLPSNNCQIATSLSSKPSPTQNPASNLQAVSINRSNYSVVNIVRPSMFYSPQVRQVLPTSRVFNGPSIIRTPSHPMISPVRIINMQSLAAPSNSTNSMILIPAQTNQIGRPVRIVTPVYEVVQPAYLTANAKVIQHKPVSK